MQTRSERVAAVAAARSDSDRLEAGETVNWIHIVRSEFLEMPGLTLTPAQGARLWGREEAICAELLDELTCAGFLRRTAHGAYRRGDTGV